MYLTLLDSYDHIQMLHFLHSIVVNQSCFLDFTKVLVDTIDYVSDLNLDLSTV